MSSYYWPWLHTDCYTGLSSPNLMSHTSFLRQFFEEKRHEDLSLTSDLLSGHFRSVLNKRNDLGKIQTFLLIIIFASWANKRLLLNALSMGSQLASLVRENGITELDEMPQDVDWLSRIAIEER